MVRSDASEGAINGHTTMGKNKTYPVLGQLANDILDVFEDYLPVFIFFVEIEVFQEGHHVGNFSHGQIRWFSFRPFPWFEIGCLHFGVSRGVSLLKAPLGSISNSGWQWRHLPVHLYVQ